MREAAASAQNARMHCRPNPWVGAVIVKDGAEVGRGFTSPVGGPHAEIHALNAASRRSRGATIYTTLEPCSHTGRTGPCTKAIIDAGISRVVIGVLDPDSKVRGTGAEILRQSGIDVEVGVESDFVAQQLAPYLHHRNTGRPYVIAKMAVTADGFVTLGAETETANRTDNDWITGEEARVRVHELRAESDVICVGAGTVRADNPALTVRHVDGLNPLRVVLGDVAQDARVHPCVQWNGELEDMLDHFGAMGMIQLMVEGGPTVLESFLQAELVDLLVLHIAPRTAGSGRALLSRTPWQTVLGWVNDARVAVASLGSDTEYAIPRAVFAPSSK